ncbi:hypothetical protein ACFE04_022132 [Oxalis oulophora]
MKIQYFLLAFLLFTFVSADPPPLQDFCIPPEDPSTAVLVKGQYCKDPKLVTSDDFYSQRLRKPGNTSNALGTAITPMFVDEFPGINGAGLAMSRVDYVRGGLNPPHLHPRASELFTVIEGKIRVGFVTTNPNNTYYTKVLARGESFIFPHGLIHFQKNIGKGPAMAVAAFSSQNPGVVSVGNAVFDAHPYIDPSVLAKSFLTHDDQIKEWQLKEWIHIINFGKTN